jgi:hypothetical protein
MAGTIYEYLDQEEKRRWTNHSDEKVEERIGEMLAQTNYSQLRLAFEQPPPSASTAEQGLEHSKMALAKRVEAVLKRKKGKSQFLVSHS